MSLAGRSSPIQSRTRTPQCPETLSLAQLISRRTGKCLRSNIQLASDLALNDRSRIYMVQENPLLRAEKSWDIEKAILRAVENPENPGKILS